ncbi:MAG: HDOD domain-containing protein [Selenomonadaceae bacterium]
MTEENINKKILFVDDEPQILNAIKRLFLDTDYEIFTADSGEKALNILAEEPVDLVITDMRMPIMDGLELLGKIKTQYPDVLRIILSGYSEKNTILTALQKNLAKLYIMKPWDNDVLLQIVNQIFETETILCNQKVIQLINRIDELPVLPNNYHKIISLIDEGADIAEISRVIEQDPAMAAKILHIINSAFYEIKTGNVQQAITLLGLETTKNIVLVTSCVDSLAINETYGPQIRMIWKHSVVSNQIFNMIYRKILNKKVSEIGSAAGLLHNIGMALFLKLFQKGYSEVFLVMKKDKSNLLDLEKGFFDLTHQQIGAYLLKLWGIPYPIVEAALYHHTPFSTGIINRELIFAVHIAQHYANVLINNQWVDTFDRQVFEELNINQSQMEKEVSALGTGL